MHKYTFSNKNGNESTKLFRVLMSHIEYNNSFKLKEVMHNYPVALMTKNILLKKAMNLYLEGHLTNKEIISVILSFGAKPNLKMKLSKAQSSNRSPHCNYITYALFIAIENNDIELVDIFIQFGADIHLKDDNGRSCLFHMFDNKNEFDLLPLCNYLIEKGADVNDSVINGYTPLMTAVIANNCAITKRLLERNANVNAINSIDGNTAIHIAIYNLNKEMIIILLEFKPNILLNNSNKENALMISKKCSDVDIYNLILQHYLKYFSDADTLGMIPNSNKRNKSIIKSTSDEYKALMKITIPFSFRIIPKNAYGYYDSDRVYHSLPLYSMITMSKTPSMHIDLSTEEKQNALINEGLISDRQSLSSKNKNLKKELLELKTDNTGLSSLLENSKGELLKCNEQINQLSNVIRAQEQQAENYLQLYNKTIEEMDMSMQSLQLKYNELKHQKIENKPIGYLERKFSLNEYANDRISTLLTRDISDYQLLVENQMKVKQNVIEKLMEYFKGIVQTIDEDIIIQIIGSFATKLNIPSSNLDLILIRNKPKDDDNITLLQILYIKFQTISWISSICLNKGTYIPSLKIITNEEYDFLPIRFQIMTNRHNSMKSLELTKSFISKYSSFKFLVLVIKNILHLSNCISSENVYIVIYNTPLFRVLSILMGYH